MKPYWTNGPCTLYHADARALPLPDESVHMVVTSPPYLGLRNYGIADAIGLEATVEDYVAALVTTFREVWRVLRPDGTCWVNLGDSYAGSGKGMNADGTHAERMTLDAGRLPITSTLPWLGYLMTTTVARHGVKQ